MVFRRSLLVFLAISGVLSAGWGVYGQGRRALQAAERARAASAPKPDILVITLCSIRADHVHSWGYGPATTPNLDRLAASSTRFVNAWSAAPYTSSSHASLLTGLRPERHGVMDFGDALAPDIPSLPEVLGWYGYRTSAFMIASGPMTFGNGDGLSRGFANFESGFASTTQMAERIATWWRAAPHPVFSVVHLRDAHQPYASAPEATDPRIVDWQANAFQAGPQGVQITMTLANALGADAVLRSQLSGVYDRGVHRADEAVGEVLGALGADADEALVVVTGDHGEALGEGGHLGHKRYLDEGVLHVPLLVRYPGQATATAVTTEVGLVDLLPTILELAHVPLPAGLDGRSLVGIESAPGWTSTGTDGRVRPVIAQLVGASGPVSSVESVVLTSRFRLEAPEGRAVLYRRVSRSPQAFDAWERIEDEPVRAALLSWFLGLSAAATRGETPELAPGVVEELRKNGYW